MKKILILILCFLMVVSLGINVFLVFFSKGETAPENVVENDPVVEEPALTEEEIRVMKYRELHPELTQDEAEKIIMMNLDLVPYTDTNTVTNPDEITVLVNKYNQLDSKYIPKDLETLYIDQNGKEVQLRKEAKENYLALADYCLQNNVILSLVSGYESYEEIDAQYNQCKNNYGQEWVDENLLMAGFDERQTGLSADIAFDTASSDLIDSNPFYETLISKLHEFGFVIRYEKNKEDITLTSSKPYRIRYVGKDVATAMYEKNITLEEFVILN